MKTWTIKTRITVAFAVLVALSATVGCLAWNSMRVMGIHASEISENSVPGLTTSADIMQNLSRAHLLLIRHVLATNLDEKHGYEAQITAISQTNSALFENLKQLCNTPEETAFENKMIPARADYLKMRVGILELSNAGKNQEALAELMSTGRAAFNAYDQLAMSFNDLETRNATEAANSIHDKASHSKFILGATVLAEIGGSMLLAVLVVTGLNRVLRGVSLVLDEGAGQVATASGQVSSASQALAQGSGEQAASIEETSSSLEELASMTRRNAENAHKANDLAKQARTAADRGALDMQTMSLAMDAIKASSDDIAKIIKTIDEIAFQTNILALNAAVEAARAGEAGMGFAVVAEEVRNLAQRSAQAAKETAAKIESAISKTGQGVEISSKVAQTLGEIVVKARQVDELAAEVATASREQTQGITQINIAVGQMDKVTQSNAASAEESAAAAQELNAQASMMKETVHQLTLLVEGAARASINHGNKIKSNRSATASKPLNGHSRVINGTKPVGESRRGEIPLTGDFKDF